MRLRAADRRVAIIGDGAMGTVCAIMLAENGCSVRLWSAFPAAARRVAAARENRRFLPGARLPDGVEVTGSDAEALADVGWAISAVPTQFMRGVWGRLAPHCPRGLAICSVAKGIENGTLLRPSQVLRDVLDGSPDAGRDVAVLSGPSIAPEVARHLPASVTVAATDPRFAQRVQRLLSRPYFRVYTNLDAVGVEVAGASKNVIAIAAGILDGLCVGDNAKAALVTRGLAEITRLGLAMGAGRDTFAGKTVEQALAATDSVVEGVATTRSVLELSGRLGVEMPITRAVHDVLFRGVAPRDAIHKLMSRPLKAES